MFSSLVSFFIFILVGQASCHLLSHQLQIPRSPGVSPSNNLFRLFRKIFLQFGLLNSSTSSISIHQFEFVITLNIDIFLIRLEVEIRFFSKHGTGPRRYWAMSRFVSNTYIYNMHILIINIKKIRVSTNVGFYK